MGKAEKIIASVSGVRGIIGENLIPANIIKFTSAFAEYCKKHSKSNLIVVGRDGRAFGEFTYSMVISNLALSGFKVKYLGVVPTPTVQIAAQDCKAAGGVVITASHNPQQWNGLKFLNSDGTFLNIKAVEEFKKIAELGIFKFADISKLKTPEADSSWLDRHILKVLNLRLLDITKIKKSKFKVVVDAVNSSGSVIVPKLLKLLGCEVIELSCNGSGIFSHTPEPIPQNLKSLSKAVLKNNADFGIAVDPDADRLVLITDKGEPFIEENTIVMVINHILKKIGGKNKNVSVNLSTTRAVDDIAIKFGAKVFRSPVGEINVVDEMKKRGSIVGGEGSGGVIIPDKLGGHYGRDCVFGIPIILNELSDSGIKLSEYKNLLPAYKIEKSKIEVSNPDKFLKEIIKKFKNNKIQYRTNCKDYY